MKDKIKDKILTAVILFSMIASGIACFANTAYAANTSDTAYSFNNYNSSACSVWRVKYNSTKVYIYPTYGPAVNYTVQGTTAVLDMVRDDSVSYSNVSSVVRIPLGVQGSVTNWANEGGYKSVRLKFTPVNMVNVDTGGYWSPDSTRNYTVYP